jgi:hypothetical protein
MGFLIRIVITSVLVMGLLTGCIAKGNSQNKTEIIYTQHYPSFISQQNLDKAKSGDARAQFQLGEDLIIAEQYQDALQWYKMAAKQGHIVSRIRIVELHEKFLEWPRDDEFRWYWYMTKGGADVAKEKIGDTYYIGEDVPRNVREAIKWYQMAASTGWTPAQ